MHSALETLRSSTIGTSFEGDLWLVGGAVRDELLATPIGSDLDLVTRGSSADLALLLFQAGASSIRPVTYERFGTAMVRVNGVDVEIVTSRSESYDEDSRKPNVEPATYEEDARRRDFTVNALLRNLHSGKLWDPLGCGLADLRERILRTPLEPEATFFDDPLRMLRAVRFRWKLGFEPAPGLYEAIKTERNRLAIVSLERVRDEFVKMLLQPSASEALQDLMDLGLLEVFAPELLPLVGCEQGSYHHLDVWKHTLLVVRNAGSGDIKLTLGALLHDVGKPQTRFIDQHGNTRFFGHEVVGADIARVLLRHLKFTNREVEDVATLVKNHMRLGSSPDFSAAAARRVLRDLGELTPRLIDLVEADASALKQGVRVLDLTKIRSRIQEVALQTPPNTLVSPLSGVEIMQVTGLQPGPEIGKLKHLLSERVIEGELASGDRAAARAYLGSLAKKVSPD